MFTRSIQGKVCSQPSITAAGHSLMWMPVYWTLDLTYCIRRPFYRPSSPCSYNLFQALMLNTPIDIFLTSSGPDTFWVHTCHCWAMSTLFLLYSGSESPQKTTHRHWYSHSIWTPILYLHPHLMPSISCCLLMPIWTPTTSPSPAGTDTVLGPTSWLADWTVKEMQVENERES